MTEQGAELFELQTTLYSSRNPTRRWLHSTRRDWIADAIRTHVRPAKRVLEVGPGSGVHLPVLAEVAAEIYAADIEDAYLSRLDASSIPCATVELVRDDITRSAFPTDHFDAVLCTEVIEHITDSGSALAEMHRILRPGGTLILSTPHRYSPLELCAKIAFLPGVIRLVRRVYREPVLETGHVNLLTRRALRAQLAEAGFTTTVEHSSGMYLPLVAELTGRHGLELHKRLESSLRGSRLDGVLWTQYAIATA